MSKIFKCVSLHSNPKIITPPQPSIVKLVPEVEPNTVAAHGNSLLINAIEEAEAVLNDAAIEASRRLNEVSETVERIKNEAHHEGFRNGYDQGIEEGRAAGFKQTENHIQQARLQANDIIAEADKRAVGMILAAEKQIIEIAINVAQKVLKREIDENPMTILPIVKEALSKIHDQDNIVIRVNPADAELVQHAQRDLQNMVGGDKSLSIVSDYTINPGGCMIDTRSGTVDASIDTQFNTLRQALRDALP